MTVVRAKKQSADDMLYTKFNIIWKHTSYINLYGHTFYIFYNLSHTQFGKYIIIYKYFNINYVQSFYTKSDLLKILEDLCESIDNLDDIDDMLSSFNLHIYTTI